MSWGQQLLTVLRWLYVRVGRNWKARENKVLGNRWRYFSSVSWLEHIKVSWGERYDWADWRWQKGFFSSLNQIGDELNTGATHTLVNESRFSLDRSDFGQGQQAVQYSAAQAQEAGVEVEVAVTHFAQANVLLLVPQASSTYRTSVKVRGHSYSMQH